MTLLLAWREIGFPETVRELALPDDETVEQASVSMWDADLPSPRTPSWTMPQVQRSGDCATCVLVPQRDHDPRVPVVSARPNSRPPPDHAA